MKARGVWIVAAALAACQGKPTESSGASGEGVPESKSETKSVPEEAGSTSGEPASETSGATAEPAGTTGGGTRGGDTEPAGEIPPEKIASGFGVFFVDGTKERYFGGHMERKGLWLVWAIPDAEGDGEQWGLGPDLRATVDEQHHMSATREQLAKLKDFMLPPATVWLVGEESACEARVGPTARLDHFAEGFEVVEVAFPLLGCEGRDWGPVAVMGIDAPETLRWHPKRRAFLYDEGKLEPADAKDPLLAAIKAQDTTPEKGEPLGTGQPYGRVYRIDDVKPRLVERESGVVFPHAPKTGEPDECMAENHGGITVGWARGDEIQALKVKGEADHIAGESKLVGAIARKGAVDAVILEWGLYGYAYVPKEGARWPREGRYEDLEVGSFHDEDQAFAFGGPWDPDCGEP